MSYSWILKVVENQVFQDHLVLQTSLPWKFLLICKFQLQWQMRTTNLCSARESSSGSVVPQLFISLRSPDEEDKPGPPVYPGNFLSLWSLAFYSFGFSLILSIRGIFSSLGSDVNLILVYSIIQLISVALQLAPVALIQLKEARKMRSHFASKSCIQNPK